MVSGSFRKLWISISIKIVSLTYTIIYMRKLVYEAWACRWRVGEEI